MNCRCSSSQPSANAADPTASSKPTGCSRTSRRPTRSPPRSRIEGRAEPSPSRGPFWWPRTGCTPPPAASASPTKVHRSGEEPCCGEARRWGRPIRTGASFTLVGNLEQRFVHYPIGPVDPATGLQRQNFIAELTFDPAQGWDAASWNQTVDPEVFLPAFADWDFDWLDIPALVGRAEQVWEYPMVDRDPAPTWLDGRMALLGDAAHVMYPVGSNGASQAIVDARVLGASMLEHGLTPDALTAYEARPHADISALVLRNRGAGPVAILGTVDERCGGVFDEIDDVIPREEIESFMARYKAAAGFAVETLNAAPRTLPEGATLTLRS